MDNPNFRLIWKKNTTQEAWVPVWILTLKSKFAEIKGFFPWLFRIKREVPVLRLLIELVWLFLDVQISFLCPQSHVAIRIFGLSQKISKHGINEVHAWTKWREKIRMSGRTSLGVKSVNPDECPSLHLIHNFRMSGCVHKSKVQMSIKTRVKWIFLEKWSSLPSDSGHACSWNRITN